MKQCAKCRKWKDESEFGKDSRLRDGLNYWCRECHRKQSLKRYRKYRKTVKIYYTYEKAHRVVDGVKEKRCRKCRKWKVESEFYKNRSYKDGLQFRCKACANKATNKARKKRLAIRN
jgi:hypothetical protein